MTRWGDRRKTLAGGKRALDIAPDCSPTSDAALGTRQGRTHGCGAKRSLSSQARAQQESTTDTQRTEPVHPPGPQLSHSGFAPLSPWRECPGTPEVIDRSTINTCTAERTVEGRSVPGLPHDRCTSPWHLEHPPPGHRATHKSSRATSAMKTRSALDQGPACEIPPETIEPRYRAASKAVSSTLHPLGFSNRIGFGR